MCYDTCPVCGRFSIHLADLNDLRAPFALDDVRVDPWSPRYNVAPTQSAPVIVCRPARVLQPMRWGLVPRWATDASAAGKTINARIETATRRPSFRDAMTHRRCVIPVTGFYEWKRVPGRRAKQPMWIRPHGQALMALAGLWEAWTAPDGEVLETFAIVTRDAAGFVKDIHDRMPVALSARWVESWLDPGADPTQLVRALEAVSADVSELEAVAVGAAVNSPAHDAPDCIDPIAHATPRGQLDLFGEANL